MSSFETPVQSIEAITDGDTMRIVLDLGYRVQFGVTTRIFGVDAPEKGTAAGKLVRQCVERWLNDVASRKYRLVWRSQDLDMYGRSLGDFLDAEHPTETLSGFLLSRQLAKRYDGQGKRAEWNQAELHAAEQSAREWLR
jgi:endonuclease YncB( thermonuclease family)